LLDSSLDQIRNSHFSATIAYGKRDTRYAERGISRFQEEKHTSFQLIHFLLTKGVKQMYILFNQSNPDRKLQLGLGNRMKSSVPEMRSPIVHRATNPEIFGTIWGCGPRRESPATP
jgi:hypothetical protein